MVFLQSRIMNLLLILRNRKIQVLVAAPRTPSISEHQGPLWTLQKGRGKRATHTLLVSGRRDRNKPNANPNPDFKTQPGKENVQKLQSVQQTVKTMRSEMGAEYRKLC